MAVSAPTASAAPAPAGPAVDFDVTKEIGYYQLVWTRFKSRRVALVSVGVLIVLGLACGLTAIIEDWGVTQRFVIEHNIVWLRPDFNDTAHQFAQPFQGGHPFGTDEIGRDLLHRTLAGGRISLSVGFLAMFATITIATTLGAVSGFLGGTTDSVITAVTNAVLSVPAIMILAVFGKVFGQGFYTVVLGISLVSWPYTSRIVRSVVLSLREKEFVEAARSLGTQRMRIVLRHILPNVLGPIVVSASLTIGAAILLESALSFLGIGIGEPTSSWGSLLNHGYRAIISDGDFFYALWPGLLILLSVLCFNYIGDALRDAFDPRSLER